MGELLNARGKRTPVFAFRVSAVRFRRGLGLVFLHEAEDKAAPEVVDNYGHSPFDKPIGHNFSAR